MLMLKEIFLTNEFGNAWYNSEGPENDVVLSTRVRLARNLANFPFTTRFTHDDGMRVQTLVFDAFSQLENAEEYQALSVKKLDDLGQKILLERGVLSSDYVKSPVAGIVVRSDGRLMCNVNVDDHIQIAAFCSGFDANDVYTIAQSVDADIQNILQIAASVKYGYLTCKLENLGTGIKLSVYTHLPSLAQCNHEKKYLSSLFSSIEAKGFSVIPIFGLSLNNDDSFSNALGNCYQISTTLCFTGTEEDQLNEFCSMVKSVIQSERLQREILCDTRPTLIRDSVYKALATVKYSRLLTEREGLDLLFRLKWGKDAGILRGIDDFQLSSLLYRIREGHISFINKTERFKFEKDVNTQEMQTERLRALIMLESIENIQIIS